MTTNSNDRTRLLDDESVEEVVNEASPQQADELPPPYQMVAGLSSIPPFQNISGQSSFGNYHVPSSNQPPAPTYYGYTYLQPATGQLTFSGGISALPTSQPVYLIPVTALPANSGQPLNINQHRSSQPRPSRTQPRNVRAPSRDPELDPNDDICYKCYCGSLIIFCMAMFLFVIVLFNMKS